MGKSRRNHTAFTQHCSPGRERRGNANARAVRHSAGGRDGAAVAVRHPLLEVPQPDRGQVGEHDPLVQRELGRIEQFLLLEGRRRSLVDLFLDEQCFDDEPRLFQATGLGPQLGLSP